MVSGIHTGVTIVWQRWGCCRRQRRAGHAVVVQIALLGIMSAGMAQAQQRAFAVQHRGAVVSARQAHAGVRPTAAGASLQGLQSGLRMFRMDVGRMPTAAEGLRALISRPAGVANWRGPYVSTNNWKQAFSDPWGNLYRYTVIGSGRSEMHRISSKGPDGVAGTRDDLSVQF